MKKIAGTKKLLLVTGLIFLTTAGVYGYLLWDVYDTNKDIQALEQEVGVLLLKEDTKQALTTLLTETESSRARLDAHLLADDEIVPFLEHIEGVGQIAGVVLDVATVDVEGAEEQQSVYEWLTVSVTAEGSWQGVYHFLSLLENVPLALVIDRADISLTGALDEDAPEVWTGRFDVRIAKKQQ